MTNPSEFWNDLARSMALRKLWFEGVSTAEIGRRIGCSKNSVVSKAHRLNLPPRPSPIIRGGNRKSRPKVKRTAETYGVRIVHSPKHTLPAMASTQIMPLPLLAASLRPLQRLSNDPCCWPIGEPRTPSFRFCDEPTLYGHPYCSEHYRRAHDKTHDGEQDKRQATTKARVVKTSAPKAPKEKRPYVRITLTEAKQEQAQRLFDEGHGWLSTAKAVGVNPKALRRAVAAGVMTRPDLDISTRSSLARQRVLQAQRGQMAEAAD
jgi:GcrA cell cycle regulator